MRMPLKWEFPGGKIDTGENPEACLRRELAEELGIGIVVRRAMPSSTHRYPTLTVTLYPFVCSIASGQIALNEHKAVAWLTPAEMTALNWLAADVPVIEAYRRSLADHPLSTD